MWFPNFGNQSAGPLLVIDEFAPALRAHKKLYSSRLEHKNMIDIVIMICIDLFDLGLWRIDVYNSFDYI